MQPSFIQQVEPTEVELSGGKVKLLFSLRAAAEIEDAFQAPYLTIVYEALGMDAQGKTAAPMSLERQARLIQILARAGGQELSLQELMDMHMTDYAALAAGTMREIFMKSPRGGKKKSPDQPIRPTDWGAWLYIAMRVFRLSVAEFFSLTPALWHMLVRGERRRGRKRRHYETIAVGAADQLPPGVL